MSNTTIKRPGLGLGNHRTEGVYNRFAASGDMDEPQLRQVERQLETADAATAAAVAFAAIVRIGQLGSAAGAAFGTLAGRAQGSFLDVDFAEGCRQIEPWAGGDLPF